jgi:hypothetical protein
MSSKTKPRPTARKRSPSAARPVKAPPKAPPRTLAEVTEDIYGILDQLVKAARCSGAQDRDSQP